MAMQLNMEFTTDLVNKRTLNTILRDTNRQVGRYVGKTVLPYKFNRYAYTAYPGIVKPRAEKYAKRKWRRLGHNIPNVYTGVMKRYVLSEGAGHTITATRNGGRVYIRNYFKMRESQRQELEALNDTDRGKMAKTAEEYFMRQIGLKKNQRKRAVKRRRR